MRWPGRIFRARWQQRRRVPAEISGQPGGEQVRAGQQRARDERGHCPRSPLAVSARTYGGTRGVVADPGGQTMGHSMSWVPMIASPSQSSRSTCVREHQGGIESG